MLLWNHFFSELPGNLMIRRNREIMFLFIILGCDTTWISLQNRGAWPLTPRNTMRSVPGHIIRSDCPQFINDQASLTSPFCMSFVWKNGTMTLVRIIVWDCPCQRWCQFRYLWYWILRSCEPKSLFGARRWSKGFDGDLWRASFSEPKKKVQECMHNILLWIFRV